jgi:hypothetical protein
MQNLQAIPFLPQPQNLKELELLKDYSHYIMLRVKELKLHPDHKADLKEILLQAMIQVTLNLHKVSMSPKTESFLFRLFHKTTR